MKNMGSREKVWYLGRLWASGAKVTSFSSQISSSSEPVSSNCWIFSLQHASKRAMFAWAQQKKKNYENIIALWSFNTTPQTHILTLSFVFKEKLMSDILSKGILQENTWVWLHHLDNDTKQPLNTEQHPITPSMKNNPLECVRITNCTTPNYSNYTINQIFSRMIHDLITPTHISTNPR